MASSGAGQDKLPNRPHDILCKHSLEIPTSGVFISYRRGGTAASSAGRLYDRLVQELTTQQVFMDVDAIEPGADFVDEIQKAVVSCRLLLAVIDPDWATVTDESGRKRLDNVDDFVRIEIAEALRRDVRVVPVLVGGAEMPRSDELPDVLVGITRRNAVTLTHERWQTDRRRRLIGHHSRDWP